MSAPTIRAIALVGFFRGDLVQPGQILELSREDFAMHRAFNQVDYAPAFDPKAEQKATQEFVVAGNKAVKPK